MFVEGGVTRDWFWLYRPPAASHRAQAVQVVNAAHAMAARGHRVTLCVQGREDPLDFCGLAPLPGLALHRLPAGNTPASLAYRLYYLAWRARTRGRGVVLARSKRHAAQALRLGATRLILEAHEVDSAQAVEQGAEPGPHLALERRVLGGAWGVVCNCEGTQQLLRSTHRALPPTTVVHNATVARWPAPSEPGVGIGYVGSVRSYKDVDTLARAAAMVGQPVVLVGPSATEVAPLQALARGSLLREEPLPYGRVPGRLVRFRALVVPEGDGLFGRQLTSPLKLWDALASGVPVVAADTPAVRAVAGADFVPYQPGDARSLARALRRACDDEPLRRRLSAARRVRSWGQRAAEVEAFADRVLGSR
jgi:glycosyltransferase involved in cell wall biosynthesis